MFYFLKRCIYYIFTTEEERQAEQLKKAVKRHLDYQRQINSEFVSFRR